jgi:hypothetical protein
MTHDTNFVSHVLKKEQMKGTQWTPPYITARTDTNKIQIQHAYNDLRTQLLDMKNLSRVILPTTVSAPCFMHNTKIDSLNKVNLSTQERTYVPIYLHTYIHTYTYINTQAVTCLTLQGYTLKCKNKILSNTDDLPWYGDQQKRRVEAKKSQLKYCCFYFYYYIHKQSSLLNNNNNNNNNTQTIIAPK